MAKMAMLTAAHHRQHCAVPNVITRPMIWGVVELCDQAMIADRGVSTVYTLNPWCAPSPGPNSASVNRQAPCLVRQRLSNDRQQDWILPHRRPPVAVIVTERPEHRCAIG
jgi:hypothetical protein